MFSLENGIKEFVGTNSDTKNALFNWGLGAVFWLVVGPAAGPHRPSLSVSHPTDCRHSAATYSLVTSPPHIERTGGAVPATPL